MKKLAFALLLVGCGGPGFDASVEAGAGPGAGGATTVAEADAAPAVVEADAATADAAPNAGGAPADFDAGAGGASSGGATGECRVRCFAGGAPGAGGASSGGAPGAGGATEPRSVQKANSYQ